MRYLPILPALALALGSCATSAVPTTTMAFVPSSTACATAKIGNGSDFVAQKARVVTSFDPRATGAAYRPPTVTTSLPSGVASGLAAVFDAAPGFFRNHLCGVTAVLVDTRATGGGQKDAYGFFEGVDQGTHSNLYIGLPIAAFRGTASFTTSENQTLANLVKGWGDFGERPRIATDPRTSRTLVLAGLMAHEMGHILWQNRAVLKGGGCDFLSYSWSSVAAAQPWRFHEFGVSEKGSTTKGKGRDDVDLAAGRKTIQAGQALKEIFESAQWASLFATVSPDEDWIETYRLLVLTQLTPNGLASLTVTQKGGTVPPFSVDVVTQLKSATVLADKAACVTRQAGP